MYAKSWPKLHVDLLGVEVLCAASSQTHPAYIPVCTRNRRDPKTPVRSHDPAAASFLLPLDEIQRLLGWNAVNRARLVVEGHAITLVSDMDNLRPERGTDELRLLLFGNATEQARHGRPVLRVQIGVDLVKNDKGARFGSLEGKDEAEGAQTYQGKLLDKVQLGARNWGNGSLRPLLVLHQIRRYCGSCCGRLCAG
ncbi:hypothetical protein N656DRAFT_579911 [Canariomyces notabilis]|uniref:Uncharacterized protein n=1 Tax=Canariomyces notabilis TaxID=2074819 RepID=A0AAN6YV82_9PEZI|nr:hypothetical protein N656DRAFT_579911 [Canariomyces arenarius]